MLKLIVLLLASSAFSFEDVDFLSDEFIDSINSIQNSWVAGRNFPKDTPIEYFRSLACINVVDKLNQSDLPIKTFTSEELRNVPHEFDARRQWSQCQTLHDIRHQGKCGSCWAIAAAEVMTDKWCIHLNQQFYFSTEDIVTCSNCGDCAKGGTSNCAFNFWTTSGVVSGGKAGTHTGCMPYTLSNVGNEDPTPPCKPQCQPSYGTTYQADKKFGVNAYSFVGEDAMKAEILKNGPISASFDVYTDIADYKGGVYSHVKGTKSGSHAVKIIGWGNENGKDYWLVANSWGTGFGEGGFMKFLRGKNECNIESYHSTSAMPRK